MKDKLWLFTMIFISLLWLCSCTDIPESILLSDCRRAYSCGDLKDDAQNKCYQTCFEKVNGQRSAPKAGQ
jgi:hypothetical protein